VRPSWPNPDGAGTHLHAYTDGVSIGFVPSFPTFPLTDQGKCNAVEAFEQTHHFLCVLTTFFQLDVLDPIPQKPHCLPANHLGDLESHQDGKVGKLGLSHLLSAAPSGGR